jgi:arylsulfatase A-like enzyme/lipopolysaccharide biosynthesis regulator YciM
LNKAGKIVRITAAGGLVLALTATWFLVGRAPAIRTMSGVNLGRLPSGVRPNDLNVLLITLDTTRWDRLGAYGDGSASTPNLDRLAGEGALFEQTIAVAPLTLPAHSTIFTGLLPPRHGVRDNGGYVLDPKHGTLASALKATGRVTGAFVGAFVLDAKFGLDAGFDTYYDKFDLSRRRSLSLGSISRTAGEVVENAMPWLDEHANRPFFAWLHFYDAHSPYEPPEPFLSRFRDRPYAGEIAYVDSQVGRVLQWLETRQLSNRTIVVVIGDHGESLNEHGEGTHGLFIYESTTRVPFIVRTPYQMSAGQRIRSVVRSEDVMPTILDLVGERPPDGIQGRTLVPLLAGTAADLNLDAYSESLYARNHYGWSELRALRSGRFKYIATTRPELYDLERDPREERNLFEERRPLADRMAEELARLAAETASESSGPSAVDPETRERLAALGYIGSFSATAKASGETLPDPKDKIEIFNLMTSAHESKSEDDADAAIVRLQKVVAEDPNILDAWVMLGNEYSRKRDYRTALEQYKRALAINPEYDLATINLAHAYRALGEYHAALVGYERYLQRDPKNALVRYQMGELFMDLGRLDQAETAFRQALNDDTRVAAARNALGVVALKRGDLPRAEQEIRQALAEKEDVKLAHFNLALIAEQRGDWKTAASEYQKEIEMHADAYKAAFNLAKLREQLGDAGGQEAAYRQAIALNPRFAEGYFYLAKLYLDQGRRLDEAAVLAQRGLAINPRSEYAPLGHYVLADVYSRQGKFAESRRQAELGREKESRRPHGKLGVSHDPVLPR